MAKPSFIVSYLDSTGAPRKVVYDNQATALRASQYLIDKGAKDVRVSIKFGMFKQESILDNQPTTKEDV